MPKTRFVQSLLYGSLGVTVLWTGSDFGPWLRGGLGAFLLGKAALATFQGFGEVNGESIAVSTGRGVRAMAIANVVAGCLVGVGALWQRNFFGFLIAYGAFSFAWVWYLIRRRLAAEKNGHAGTSARQTE